MKLRTFKASDEDYAKWCAAAEKKGMAWSAWVRQTLDERDALERALENEKKNDSASEYC
jgi:hypothetical protein